MSLLDDFEILIVEPDMSLCHYGGGGWSDAWRSGWESAVAACNLELMRRIYAKESPGAEPAPPAKAHKGE